MANKNRKSTATAHLLPRDEAIALFHTLPYAGNQTEIGAAPDCYGNYLAGYRDNDGNHWVFTHDESWDNVDVASVNGVNLY